MDCSQSFCGRYDKMGEKEVIKERIAWLYPLASIIEDAAAEVDAEMSREKYNDVQKRNIRSVRINMHVREKWKASQADNPWELIDASYFHLRDRVTGMYVELHPALWGKMSVVKPANTEASCIRFRQSACRSADEMQFCIGDDGTMVPDLSGVSGQLIWKEEDGEVVVWFFKPLDGEKRLSAFDCPVLRDRDSIEDMRFERAQENQFMLDDLRENIDEDIASHPESEEDPIDEARSVSEETGDSSTPDGNVDRNQENKKE